jgi:hypothetical protein
LISVLLKDAIFKSPDYRGAKGGKITMATPGLFVTLSLQAFDLEDDFGGNGSFLIKHDASHGGLRDGADFSGDAERKFMNGMKGVHIEEGRCRAGKLEVVRHMVFGFLQRESRHVVADGDALVEMSGPGSDLVFCLFHLPSEKKCGPTANGNSKGSSGV